MIKRIIIIALGLAAWFLTQSWIGQREFNGGIGDGVLELLSSANFYLNKNPDVSSLLLILSSLVIDALGIFLLWQSVVGKSMRPFVGLLILFGMRQLCQAVCTLPAPDSMVWFDPTFPSLLVTYDVSNDFFFSGHTGIAVLGAVEIVRLKGRKWLPLGVMIVAFEALTVLVLHAHYTMDVFTGIIAALYASELSTKLIKENNEE